MLKRSGQLNHLFERSQDYLFHAWTVLALLALIVSGSGLPLNFLLGIIISALIALASGALIGCVQLSFTVASLLMQRWSRHKSLTMVIRSTAPNEISPRPVNPAPPGGPARPGA